MPCLSSRAYGQKLAASSWEEIWEAGPYFDRISNLLEDAREYVIFVGWQIDSRIRLCIPERPGQSHSQSGIHTRLETLQDKVIRLCDEKPNFKVYFLLWDHAYLYVLEREFWQARKWENIHQRVFFVFDNRHPLGGSHHEKICIIDGCVALCGGIDLCDERWDTPLHLYWDERRSLDRKKENHGPYHDLAVQVSGPVCRGILEHIEQRWAILSSVKFPKSPDWHPSEFQSDSHQVYISRTFTPVDKLNTHSKMIREVEFLFRDLIWNAQKRIILEGQYYWSQTVNDLLISKVHQMKGKNFEVVLILAELQNVKSLTKHMMAYELKLLRKLILAANFSGVKLTVGAPYVMAPEHKKGLPPKPVYIHSKVLVIDDRYLAIGSANFADRALRVDTEIQLTLEAKTQTERKHIKEVGDQILEHWRIQGRNSSSYFNNIYLRDLKPDIQLGHLPSNLRKDRWFSWQYFFDPPVPWFYSLKLKYLRMMQRDFLSLVHDLLLIWLSGSLVAWALVGGFESGKVLPLFFYCAVLTSVWLFPVPFLPISLLAALHLGTELAIKVAIAALWVASIFGYYVARIFPVTAGRFYGHERNSRLSRWLGFRQFKYLVFVLVDPTISIQSKIIYQGLYSFPVPWFILGTWVILPAIIYAILIGFGFLVREWSSLNGIEGTIGGVKESAELILFLLMSMSLGKVMTRISSYGKTPTSDNFI